MIVICTKFANTVDGYIVERWLLYHDELLSLL